MPDLEAKLPVLKADLVAALCRDLTGIAERIMELGEALPGSNIGVLVANRPGMLLDPPERIAEYRWVVLPLVVIEGFT